MTLTALLWAVVLSGIYHGINPGMGWPLVVSAALMESKKKSAMVKAIAMLGAGHFLAMIIILLPISLLSFLVVNEGKVRVVAGLMVISMGIYLLINRRHPKILARVHPAKLGLWSFLAATAHGAGLMLVPIFLGITGQLESGSMHAEAGHEMAHGVMSNNVLTAFAVSMAHTLAMTLSGALLAILVYVWFGLKFISKSWFNLDLAWALTLIVVGAFGIFSAFGGHSGHGMH